MTLVLVGQVELKSAAAAALGGGAPGRTNVCIGGTKPSAALIARR
jgi:hypothetical protein